MAPTSVPTGGSVGFGSGWARQHSLYSFKLLRNVKQMITTFDVDETLYWKVCEDCGACVSTELSGPHGAGECDDGGFYCTSCRFGDDEA